MDRCTTIHSNLSMWAVSRKWFVAKLHPQNLLFSQLVQVTHFITSHRNIISRLLIRKSLIFPWLSISAVLCLNLESPLATRQFIENTSQSLLEQSGSHGYHMTFCWETSYLQKWLPEIDSVKPLSMRTGGLIGSGSAFFVKGLDIHAKCTTSVAITESSFEKSHAQHARSHIRHHRNAKECAETTGFTLM